MFNVCVHCEISIRLLLLHLEPDHAAENIKGKILVLLPFTSTTCHDQRLYGKLKSSFCQVSLSWPQEETLTFNITRPAPFVLAFQGEEEEASQQIRLSHQRTPSQPRARLQTQVTKQPAPHTRVTVERFCGCFYFSMPSWRSKQWVEIKLVYFLQRSVSKWTITWKGVNTLSSIVVETKIVTTLFQGDASLLWVKMLLPDKYISCSHPAGVFLLMLWLCLDSLVGYLLV